MRPNQNVLEIAVQVCRVVDIWTQQQLLGLSLEPKEREFVDTGAEIVSQQTLSSVYPIEQNCIIV